MRDLEQLRFVGGDGLLLGKDWKRRFAAAAQLEIGRALGGLGAGWTERLPCGVRIKVAEKGDLARKVERLAGSLLILLLQAVDCFALRDEC